jgi:glutathione S-transferase
LIAVGDDPRVVERTLLKGDRNPRKAPSMKLYYSAGSCSTSCHITLEESGLKYEAIGVDWDDEKDPNVALVPKLNPLGTLPVAVIEGDRVLSQNVAIHTYVADLAPEKKLLPKAGTPERAVAMNWLSFVSSDFHKSFSPLFGLDAMTKDAATKSQLRDFFVKGIQEKFAYLDQSLAGKDYLMGKDFTVADAYCFVIAGWAKWLKIPVDSYRNVGAYLGRIAERPAVQRVLKAEGLN